tara:strand:- start:46 stop:528 length:483 start_codon:yes stop_codon:yes gene_type:complete
MKKKLPKLFVVDVDGVMTTGQFLYDEKGKKFKIFGPDDADALKLLNKFIKIVFVSADKRGFKISKKRISDDMGYKLFSVSSENRLNWINKNFNINETIYMGDGIYDHLVMKKVFYSICTSNSATSARKYSRFITKRTGGDRAVSEACLHILKKFFNHTII